jgi:hypothetical protein
MVRRLLAALSEASQAKGTPAARTAGATNSVSSPNLGQITSDISCNNGLTSAGDPGIVQLAMKFVF